jgi:hypothetical protein
MMKRYAIARDREFSGYAQSGSMVTLFIKSETTP